MENLTVALTREMFQRTRVSAALGTLGVIIMIYPHMAHVDPLRWASWACLMVALLSGRVINSFRRLDAISGATQALRRCNLETMLCGLIGLGWGATVFVFDSQAMDALFYLRFLILATAMAFIVTSTSVFLRVSSAYTMPIGAATALFITLNDYVQPRGPLVFSVVLYTVMIFALSATMNKQIRSAIVNQLAVSKLTEDLKVSLNAERKLRDELSVRADTDELTGAFNRRGVITHLNAELARSRRFRSPVAVMMADIDHFKRVNDTHGHAAGDAALRAMTYILRKQLRETDLLGRIGGEEFLVILPAMELQGAMSVAERMRQCVETSVIELPEHSLQITVSIGVSVYAPDDTADKLIARADNALYQAKESGRNRVLHSLSEVPV